ncbi:hypothetical protein CCACVL1_22572, partial [Corchorus capsularis]
NPRVCFTRPQQGYYDDLLQLHIHYY